MSAGRRANLQVTWQGTDITTELAPHLLELTYTDNLTGAADDLTFSVEDREGLWAGDWRPATGDTVVGRISADPWLTEVNDLRLGKFAHDKIELVGPPRTARISAVSAPLATGLRRRKRTRAWASVTLFQIAEDIASRAKLQLDWIGSDGLVYARREQKDKSDLEFLEEACKEVGRALKVTEDTIVIFPEQDQEETPSVGELDLRGGHVLSYQFTADESARYGVCHVKFFDPRAGKSIEAEYTDPNNPDGQTLEIRLPVDSAGQAQSICKGKLRDANRFGNTGSLEVHGDPGLVAGVTFDLINAGSFNGQFIITKATHRPVGGYRCSLEVRRCAGGY